MLAGQRIVAYARCMNDQALKQPKKLSDFKPLKRLVLPDLGELDASGLTVFVGPNSSGKTQLLRDIKERITGDVRDLVVAAELEIERPNFLELVECLKSEGDIETFRDDNDNELVRPRTIFAGAGQAAQQVAVNDASNWHAQSVQGSGRRRKDQYLGWTATYLVSALFLENRLSALNPPGLIDFQTEPPQHDLHALHLNDHAIGALIEESTRAFSKAVWTDLSRGKHMHLRVAQDGAYSTPFRPVIPRQAGHPFQRIPATDSMASRPAIPGESGHL